MECHVKMTLGFDMSNYIKAFNFSQQADLDLQLLRGFPAC
jgi:hypothetical protein